MLWPSQRLLRAVEQIAKHATTPRQLAARPACRRSAAMQRWLADQQRRLAREYIELDAMETAVHLDASAAGVAIREW